MKIKVIIPSSSQAFLAEQQEIRIAAAGNMASVTVCNVANGPESIETAYDVALSVPPLVQAAKQAEKEGFDGISIDCAADPGLRAVRDAVSIPVMSAGESSYMLAMTLCRSFSVIAVMKQTSIIIQENIRTYCLEQRVTSVEFANVPVLKLNDIESSKKAIKHKAELAIKAGADAIVLGCTGMAAQVQSLEEELGVAVIDPGGSAIQMLIAVLQSRKTYKQK